MNWLKKGPELKLPKLRKPSLKGTGGKGPQIEPPRMLADLYYDLRDRRLLLPIALVLVAIAAVPFLMGSDSEPLPAAPAEVGAARAPAGARSLAVVEATPGLRDYRKRLKGRSPSDPFKQPAAGVSAGGGSGSEGSGGGSGGGGGASSSFEESVTVEDDSTTVEIDPGDPGGTGGGGSGGSPGGSGGGGAAPAPGGAPLYGFVFNVQVSHTVPAADGGKKMSEPVVRRRLPTFTQLPGAKLPLATLAGVNLHNGRVWLLVSDEAKSLDGEFACTARTPNGICELLEVEPGFPFEVAYGPEDDRYRFKVTGVDAVASGKVGDRAGASRAPFGLATAHNFSK